MKATLFISVLCGVISLMVIALSGRYSKKVRSSKFSIRKVLHKLSIKGYEDAAIIDKTERYLYEAGGGVSTEAFLFFHLIVATVAFIMSYKSLTQLDLTEWMIQFLKIMALGFLPLHAIVIYSIQNRKKKILKELTKITNVLYYSSKQGIKDDLVYFKCAEMVDDPLKDYFKRLAIAHSTKQDVSEILKEMRGLCDAPLLQNLVSILQRKTLTGQSEQNLKVLKSIMHTGKKTRYKVWRDARRLQVIGYAMALGTCLTLLMALPIILEMINDLKIMWSS